MIDLCWFDRPFIPPMIIDPFVIFLLIIVFMHLLMLASYFSIANTTSSATSQSSSGRSSSSNDSWKHFFSVNHHLSELEVCSAVESCSSCEYQNLSLLQKLLLDWVHNDRDTSLVMLLNLYMLIILFSDSYTYTLKTLLIRLHSVVSCRSRYRKRNLNRRTSFVRSGSSFHLH